MSSAVTCTQCGAAHGEHGAYCLNGDWHPIAELMESPRRAWKLFGTDLIDAPIEKCWILEGHVCEACKKKAMPLMDEKTQQIKLFEYEQE